MTRRGFIGVTAAATLAALVGHEPQAARARRTAGRGPARPPTPSSCCGWPAAWRSTETFDPKRYTPFAPGVPIKDVLSTFPTIDTKVDHIKFTQGLEQIASVIDKGAVIRTFTAADLGFILHSRHQYHWHTGYIPPQPMAMPHIGSVISRTLGPRHPDMPAFIAIGQTVEGAGEIGTLKAFHTAGFLGTDHGPFLIVDPQDAASAVRPPKELGDARFASRRELFEKLLAQEPVYQYGSAFQREAVVQVARLARIGCCGRRRRRRSTSRSSRRSRSTPTTPAGSARAACSRAGWSRPARAMSRSRPSTSRSSTGTRTRTAISASRT